MTLPGVIPPTVSVDPYRLVWVNWVHLVSCRVAVDAKVSGDLLEFAAAGDWENASVRHHGYLREFLLCSEGVRDLMKVSVAFI